MKLVLPGIWTFEGMRLGRAYLVEDTGGLTMIDSNQSGTLTEIEREIASIGRRIEDLHSVIATHHHPDHAGCAPELRERTGAKVYAHSLDTPFIDGRKPRPAKKRYLGFAASMVRDMASCAVDHELRDGEELSIAGGLRVIHSPGHTSGHISLIAPARRVLFAGDAFANWFGLQPPFRPTTENMDQAKRSIGMLARLDFDHALPGHGNPVLNHASEKLRQWVSRWFDHA